MMPLTKALSASPSTTSSAKGPLNLPLSLPPLTSTPEALSPSRHGDSSLGSRKRVGFHPVANVHHSSDPLSSSHQPVGVKPLPPSRECYSSSRSILKVRAQWEQSVGQMDDPGQATSSLNEAIESISPQFSSDDKKVLVEAYQALASAMRAYDELPDAAAMKLKLNSLSKQMRTHLKMCQQPGQNVMDSSLITSILKVAVILVWSPDMSPLLHDKFRCFLLDTAIQAVVDHKAPKNVVMHYLHLLATQNFECHLMGYNERAPRLMEALASLSDHYKGNGPASERLMVYTKLVEQRPREMHANASTWIVPMLEGMCSPVPALRVKALELGRKAYQAFPSTNGRNSIAPQIRHALEPQGRDKSDMISVKLEKLIANKDSESALVPQIWALVLLLADVSAQPIENWAQFKSWLVVIQRCFNGSDPALRQQAYLAWNRFVFVARPYEASNNVMEMLVKPIIARLERTSTSSTKGGLELAVSTYCNLLYYTFRPGTSPHHYSTGWLQHVAKVFHPSLFEKCPAYTDFASRILMALLWDARTTTKVWNVHRAHETRLVEPEELPTIDCKWVRKKCAVVLSTFQILFRYSSWGLVGSSDQAFISKAWKHFLRAIRNAGSKEIKMTKDMRSAITAIADLIAEPDIVALDPHALQTVIRLTVTELGPGPMLEVLDRSPHWRHAPLLCQILSSLFEREVHGQSSTKDIVSAALKKSLKIIDNSLRPVESEDGASVSTESASQARELCQVLACLPEQSALPYLSLLDPCLSSWLRSGAMFLSDKDILDAVGMCALKVLATVPPCSVAGLDGIFSAALSSSHSTTARAAGALWNKSFRNSPDLDIGPQVQQAILHLKPDLEVEAALATDDGEKDRAASVISINDGYDDEKKVEAEIVTVALDEMDEMDESKKVATSEIEGWARKNRHDCQVNGVTADLAALEQEADSRLETERGTESREMQRPESSIMFADVRCSLRPRSSPSQSRDCEFARKAASMAERPSTPTFSDAHDARDVEVVPSPTPKARHVRGIEEADIPSSPPSMQGRNTDGGNEVGEASSTPTPTPQEANRLEHNQHVSHSPTAEENTVIKTTDGLAGSNAGLAVQMEAEGECTNALDGEERTPRGRALREGKASQPPKEAMMEGTAITAEPGTPSSHSASDDLEQMSASQLTHDLEWSQVMEESREVTTQDQKMTAELSVQSAALDVAKRASGEPSQAVSDESEPTPTTVGTASGPRRNLRKRKRTAATSEDKGRRRRRRRTGSQEQSEAKLSQSCSQERDPVTEIYDEIVASSSPLKPTWQAAHNSVPTKQLWSPDSKKPVSRKQRWMISLSQSPEPEPVDVVVDDNNESAEANPVDQVAQAEEGPWPAQQEDGEEGQADTEMQMRDGDQVHEQAGLPSSKLDLISSLRQTLELAKTAATGSFDLRAVADLCFEIQHVATLRAANMGARAE